VDEKNSQFYASLTPDYTLVTKVTVDSLDNPNTTVKAFVDENGMVKFTGLGVGTYTITETTTPSGYNTIDPITFTVTFDVDNKTFISDNSKVMVNGATNTLYSEIVNVSGSTLPSTGGMGTTLFYAFGGAMVLAAVVLLVTKKRMAV
jgi:LPXTG-motif cell wall-anchored protein